MNQNASAMRVGAQGASSPPLMMCYRPSMAESNLVSTIGSFLTCDRRRQSLCDAKMKQMKQHITKNMSGFNDVSRYTCSTILPESSELPAARQLNANQSIKLSTKGNFDQQVWKYQKAAPKEVHDGPRTHFITANKLGDPA